MAMDARAATWVPVDERRFGMDRRALTPAALVAVFAALCFWGLPAWNSATAIDDVVRAGDVIRVGEDVAFVPATGWTIASGVRAGTRAATVYPTDAQVVTGAESFSLTTGRFVGTPRQLLDQLRSNNSRVPEASAVRLIGEPVGFTTATGLEGALTRFTNGPSVGFLATLVIGSTGVETVAVGPDAIDGDTTDQIIAMVESIRPTTAVEKRGAR